MSLRRKTDPKPPAPEQGASTVTTVALRDPDALLADLNTRAAAFEDACKQDYAAANRLRLDAEEHQRQAGEAAAEEMRLLEQLDAAKQKRAFHDQGSGAKLTEAKSYAERAKQNENRAADIRTSMALIQQSQQNGNGQPLDPTAETRMDQSLARIDAAHAELPEKHRDEGDL